MSLPHSDQQIPHETHTWPQIPYTHTHTQHLSDTAVETLLQASWDTHCKFTESRAINSILQQYNILNMIQMYINYIFKLYFLQNFWNTLNVSDRGVHLVQEQNLAMLKKNFTFLHYESFMSRKEVKVKWSKDNCWSLMNKWVFLSVVFADLTSLSLSLHKWTLPHTVSCHVVRRYDTDTDPGFIIVIRSITHLAQMQLKFMCITSVVLLNIKIISHIQIRVISILFIFDYESAESWEMSRLSSFFNYFWFEFALRRLWRIL